MEINAKSTDRKLLLELTGELDHQGAAQAIRELEEHYTTYLKSHDCGDLIELAMSIYAKKQDLASQHRKFGAVDERFMKRAEDLLYGELAVALKIDRDQVPSHISNRINALQRSAKA